MEENEGVQNADAGGECEKNEDEDDFSFACTNPDRSLIFTDDIFQNYQIHLVFPVFNPDLLFAYADDSDSSKARSFGSSFEHLSSSGLRGEIAASISNLTMIQSLDLLNNNLTGPIPKFLSKFQSLTVLNLEKNKFTGSVPLGLIERKNNGFLSLRCHFVSLMLFLPPHLSYFKPALDKIRFESIIDKSKLDGQPELFIPDKNNNTLTIIDSGIGMTKADFDNGDMVIQFDSSFFGAPMMLELVVVRILE
ncbi:unnamed protein product [Prunus armeniaca]